MKLDTLMVEVALSPFAKAIGEKSFPKIVNDVKALLGRVESDIEVKNGDWKAGAKYKLTRKSGESVQLPANNPASVLLCFGMRLNELSNAGEFTLEAEIPKQCKDWIVTHSKSKAQTEATPTVA